MKLGICFGVWPATLSANAMQGDVEKCRQAGMNGHIAKPINPHALQTILAQFMQKAPVVQS